MAGIAIPPSLILRKFIALTIFGFFFLILPNISIVNYRKISTTHKIEELLLPWVTEYKWSSSKFSIAGCPCVRNRIAETISTRRLRGNAARRVESTCSSYATSRGPGQKVFSYCYYRPRHVSVDDHFKVYMDQMEEKLKIIKKNFPRWIVRLYHNISIDDTRESQHICDLFCKYDFLDPCDVTDLPMIGNLYKRQPIGRLWRYAVMGDPMVDIFMSRDTDSSIIKREVKAVNEWLHSGKSFHVMRDHPYHKSLMFAGLWGARNKPELEELRDKMLFSPPDYNKFFDQISLADVVWPTIKKNDILQHTSYHCNLFEGAKPFPTRRVQNYYVGWGHYKTNFTFIVQDNICPVECRPEYGQDWIRC